MKKSFSPFFYVFTMIAIIMAFYSFERIVFFIWNNHGFIDVQNTKILKAFFYGLRFDIYALLLINVVSILFCFIPFQKYQKVQIEILKYLLLIPNVFFIAINQIDTEFTNFAGRRMTWGNLPILLEAKGKISAFFMTYGLLMTVHILCLIAFIYLTYQIGNYFKKNPVFLNTKHYAAIIILIIPLLVLGARGGTQRKPLTTTHAIIFDNGYLNQMVLNSSFTLLRSKSAKFIKERNDFKDTKESRPFLNGANAEQTIWTTDLSKEKNNVVLIIFESLSQDHFKFAPFLNSLAQKGLYFSNNYANGRRSIEAIPSILAGIPALMPDAYITSPYFNNDLRGIGTYFKKLNYETLFFHGGSEGTMYFDQFTRKAGFDKYYSSKDHPDQNDFDGYWGIFDEPYLQFALKEINKINKPFVSSIFTLTSHHPYVVPEKYKNTLPDGEIPIIKTIAYTDNAIKLFFEEASKKSWYKNTLFIITGDHTSFDHSARFSTAIEHYRVPLVMYHPQIKSWPNVDQKKLTQHVDILPTLLDIFKIEDPEKSLFGKSIFNDKSSQVTILSDQIYYFIKDDYVLEMRPDQIRTFDIAKNLNFKYLAPNNEVNEKYLKATLQYYNNNLIYNSLYLK